MASAELTRIVRELQDREQIRDVLARYCRGVDRLDAETIRSVYHPDSFDDHGPFKGGPEDFIAWIIPFLRAEYTTCSHHLTTQIIELQGDVADVETYAIVVQDRDRAGVRYRSTAHARYIDRMERRNGEWRIARRLVVTDSGSTNEAPPWFGTTKAESLGGGRRDRSDPAFARLVES